MFLKKLLQKEKMHNGQINSTPGETNPQSFWYPEKVTWTVKEKINENILKFLNKTPRELGIMVGCVVATLFAIGAVIVKDVDKSSSWKPDVTTEIVGGGLIAGILGTLSGLLTFKLAKCCSRSGFEDVNELKNYIRKNLQEIYKEYGKDRLKDEDLKMYWENGIVKDSSISELAKENEIYCKPNLIKENTPLMRSQTLVI